MTIAGHRLESLDVFRGATIAAMILVNNPGDWSAVFPPLMHAGWTGWTFADLVFPWFIFIMGVALSLVFRRRLATGEPLSTFHRRVWRRNRVWSPSRLRTTGIRTIARRRFSRTRRWTMSRVSIVLGRRACCSISFMLIAGPQSMSRETRRCRRRRPPGHPNKTGEASH